jgi:hypothetical protein
MRKIMKKSLIYSLFLAAATALCSCNGDYDDWADPQGYDAENPEGMSLTVVPASSVDMATLGDATTYNLFTPVLEIPENAQLSSYKLTLSDAGQEPQEVAVDESGNVSVDELTTAVATIFGKRPVARVVTLDVQASVVSNGQAFVVKADPVTWTVTLQAPVIESAYYLVGDMLGWDAASMAKFSHSDADVYEDPVFTITFSTTGSNQYWKIIPQSNVDANDIWAPGVVGTAIDGDASLEGKLVNENANAGKIEKAGMYKMTINMMDYTYVIEEQVPEYFLVGALQGWNASASGMTCMLYPQSVSVHSYTTTFSGDHNLKVWMSTDFGNWDKAVGTATDGDASTSGVLGGSGAICAPEADVYYTFTADFANNTYTWTKLANQSPATYNKIGLIGDFNSWGGDEELTQVTPHNWMVSDFTVTSTGSVKFRANGGWDVNWGAAVDLSTVNYGVGVSNGDNMTIAPGTYDVYFNDITGEFVFRTR